jgi:hypothetical protein
MSIHPFPVESFGLGQALADEVKITLRCGDTALRFLLECVQRVNRIRVADRINRTPSVAAVVGDYFKNGSSTKTLQGFGR